MVRDARARGLLNGVPLRQPPPERRKRDGRLELVAIESADPRWLAASSDALEARDGRLRARRGCVRAVRRSTELVGRRHELSAVSRHQRRLVVRESGGLVAFTAMEDPLGAPLDLEPRSPVVAARTDRALAELASLPAT